MMFQLLKWRRIAGASDSAIGRRINRRVSRRGVSIACQLFLALRAPEGRAAVLVEAANGAAAAPGLALLALAVIDLERMLEITEFTRGLAMVAQRRTAGLDRLVQHRVNLVHQIPRMIGGFAFFGRKGRGEPAWRQMGAVECLADIDVAKSRHHALVEQRRLQARLLVVAGARQEVGVELIAERLGAE